MFFQTSFLKWFLWQIDENDAKIDSKIIIHADNQNIVLLLPVEAGNSKMRLRRILIRWKIDEKSIEHVESFSDRSWDRSIFDGFLLQVGMQNRVKIDIRWCWTYYEKMIMTWMALWWHVGDYESLRHHRFVAPERRKGGGVNRENGGDRVEWMLGWGFHEGSRPPVARGWWDLSSRSCPGALWRPLGLSLGVLEAVSGGFWELCWKMLAPRLYCLAILGDVVASWRQGEVR